MEALTCMCVFEFFYLRQYLARKALKTNKIQQKPIRRTKKNTDKIQQQNPTTKSNKNQQNPTTNPPNKKTNKNQQKPTKS